ncbi:thiamine phosphate synthase [Pseudonocardia yunnanensis]|uniref:Thiamine phosphate synthase n=1 Tax=Pseudonocardia yunnanensis TaxID=58107 RepID=A0ABW4EP49_9PSEU
MDQRTDSLDTLSRTAARLRLWVGTSDPLPRLLFFTDPVRTPQPEAVAERLPTGAGIVYRPFGAADAVARGLRLAEIARRRRLVLLAGADPALAETIEADGLHLPQRLVETGPTLRAAHPAWRLTVAAHDAAAVHAAERCGAEAVVVSPVFPSNSASATNPLGVAAAGEIAKGSALPVYALGGVNAKTAGALIHAGVYGLAAIEAFVA